jgi:flagellar motor switch protein FliG
MLEGEILDNNFDNGLINSPMNNAVASPDVSIEDLTPPQKAAIILVTLGAEKAAPIIEKLTDEHIERFLRALQQLREVPREKILGVIADFIVNINSRQGIFKAGPDRAMEMARSVLDDDRFARLTMDASISDAQGPQREGIWGEMEQRSAKAIAEFLLQQKPEIAVYILSKLEKEIVSEIVTELPEKESVEFVKRLSDDAAVAPFVEKAIEKFIRAEFLSVEEEGSNSEAITYVADLLSVLPRDRREGILEEIEKDDEERSRKIRNEMLTFDDLPERLPPTAIQIIFREYNKVKLREMLKAGALGSQMVTEFLYSNISQRMADQIREEVDAMEEMDEKKADKTLSVFMSYIGQLQKDGRITLNKKADPVLPDLG